MPCVRFCRFAAALILIGMTCLPANAWWGGGHMVIALLAYREMPPATRSRVDSLLKSHPDYRVWLNEIPAGATDSERTGYLFAIAATWPDRIKDFRDKSVTVAFYDPTDRRHPAPVPLPVDSRYPDLLMHKDWHYSDTPISADGVVRANPVGASAVTQIPICEQNLGNQKLPASVRAYYLAWLEHLVGDIHQPLHATSRYSVSYPTGDQGGNGVKLDHSLPRGPANLHSYWDSLLGDGGGGPGSISYPTDWKSIEATVAAVTTEESGLLSGFDPATRDDISAVDWAHESLWIDQTFVYTMGPDGLSPLPEPDSGYHAAAVRMAHERAALAGHRLALVITTALTRAE